MSPTCPDTFYGQTKLDAEQIVLKARRADGAPLGTVLRFGAIYGSRIKGNYERLTNALSRNRFIPVGDGMNRRTLIYDKDVGRAVVQVVLKARRADGAQLGTVLRFGAIYGSRIKGNYERLTRALAGNLGTRSQFLGKLGHVPHFPFIPVGNGLNRRTLIYDKDVGRAVVQVVSHPAAAGRLYNVTDGGFYSMNEIIEAICLALGRKSPLFSLPAGPMRMVAGLITKGAGFFGKKAPITRETVDKYTEDIAVDGSLFQKEIGFVPQFDLKAGWRDAVGKKF